MTRTKGDTSPTHTTARFIAVDDNAVASDKPVHAATCRRIARNSNWLEGEIHRVLFHEQWTQDNDVAGASRSATPLDAAAEGQVIVRRTEPTCLGPWRVDTLRPEVRLQLGGGLDAAESIQYYWELHSENPTSRPPARSDWSTLSNGGGAAAWVDSSVTEKRTRAGEVDWVRLWLQSPSAYYASGQPDNTQGSVLEIYDDLSGNTITTMPTDGIAGITASAVQCETRLGGESAFSGADWTRFDDRTLILFRGSFGAGSAAPTIDEIVLGPLPLAGASDRAGAPSLESLVVGYPGLAGLGPFVPYGEAVELADMIAAGSLKYVIFRTTPVALRYALAREERLTSLAAGEPYRVNFHPLDDALANTGRETIRHLLVSAQDNADALSLGQSQPIANDRFDIRPDRGPTLHRITLDSSDTTFTTVVQLGAYVEADYEDLLGTFEYAIQSTTLEPLAVSARLALLDDSGSELRVGTAVTLEYAHPGTLSTEGGAVGADIGDQWWPGPWWSSGQRRMSPEMSCTTESYTGTGTAVALQLRASFTGSAVVTVYVRSLHVVGAARR